MKFKAISFMTALLVIMYACTSSEKKNDQTQAATASIATQQSNQDDFNGFRTQVELGAHLVATGDCDVCHSPKKMSEHGPVVDSTLRLSGHPSAMPAPSFAGIEDVQSKGYTITQTLTSWVGPWGISYAANLTPDDTGIGTWTEQQFIKSMREGKYKGMEKTRPIMPPMPWQAVGKHTDTELKAMFAYLKSLKPIKNAVPNYQPPAAPTAKK